jgi:hypothetical protein
MAIHGIISTYFGDLEFDLGKSLTWTKAFCDTMYVMDVNTAEAPRQYVVNWDYSFPNAKHSFFSQYSFLSNPTNAKNWRKESFTRAKSAWNYDPDDWVMFIDGSEGLNVYHAPPVNLVITSAETVDTFDDNGYVIFTTDGDHGAEVGNILRVLRATITTTVESEEVVVVLDGAYLVDDVPSSTTIKVIKEGMNLDIADTALDEEAHGVLTTEPAGFLDGNLFKSWIEAEIANTIADGKNFISLDGWALIRSSSPDTVSFDMTQPVFDNISSTIDVVKCDEYYVDMGRMIRIGKVSSFSNPAFNWLSLDQPEESFANAYPADLLSLISYAYVRWSDTPTRMTQSVNAADPFYVDPLDDDNPPLRPVSEEDDAGFAMRRLISNVRPLVDVPVVWSDPDPYGEQPMVGIYQKLDLNYVQQEDLVDGEFVPSGYSAFGGSPLYPGVLRSNLREGVWYTRQGSPPIRVNVASASVSDGVATAVTGSRHYLTVGTSISIYGTDPNFDGTHVITGTPTSTTFTFDRPIDDVASTSYSLGQGVTMPQTFGPVPWNYLLNTFGIDDPAQWLTTGKRRTTI